MAILTASSSSVSPQNAIGMAKSQSSLCCEVAARKAARWMGELRLFSTIWRSTWMLGRSQNGCFPGRVPGTVPKEDDQTDRYSWRNELSEQVQSDRISAWSECTCRWSHVGRNCERNCGNCERIIIIIIIIIRPRRSRSAAAYSDQTILWTICRSVRRSVRIRASVCSVHCWKTADRIRMPFGIRSDGSRDEAGSEAWDRSTGRGTFGANLGRAIVTNGDFTAYVCDSAATWSSSQISLGRLVIIIATAASSSSSSSSVVVVVVVCDLRHSSGFSSDKSPQSLSPSQK